MVLSRQSWRWLAFAAVWTASPAFAQVDAGVAADGEVESAETTDGGSHQPEQGPQPAAESDSVPEAVSGSATESDSDSGSASVTEAGSESDAGSESEAASVEESDSESSDEDPYGGSDDDTDPPVDVRYFLERVVVEGNESTRSGVIQSYVPFRTGEAFGPEDPRLEALEWRLLGTGWFRRVAVRIERGRRRGWVKLIVQVEERNTIVASNIVFGISEGLNTTADTQPDIVGYFGATLTETNLFGSGAQLSLTGLGSNRAYGFRLAYSNPRLFPRQTALRVAGFFNRARQYFGVSPRVSGSCDPDDEACMGELEARNAVVFYSRGGVSIGTGRDIGASAYYTLDWQGELVNIDSMPEAASETRGTETRAIQFGVQPDLSFVSLIRAALVYDRRDDPGLPTRGLLLRVGADVSHPILGSRYQFLKLQLRYRGWARLPWGHSLSLGLFVGAVFGDAPFFYKFHISDLTDLIPSRYLEMQLDRRRSDYFDTAIQVMQTEKIAGRVDVEYTIPLFRGNRAVRALHAYLNIGLIMLTDPKDLTVSVPGFVGFGKVPIDPTLDIGLRMDTTIGVFQFGFSNLLGFFQL